MNRSRKLSLLEKLARRGKDAGNRARAKKQRREKAKADKAKKARGNVHTQNAARKAKKAPPVTTGTGRKLLNFAKTKAGIATMLTAGVGTGLGIGLPFVFKGKKKKLKLKGAA